MNPRLGAAPVEAGIFDYGLTLVTFTRPDQALEAAHAEIAAELATRLDRALPIVAALLRTVHDRVDLGVADHEAAGHLEELDHVELACRAWRDLGFDLDGEVVDTILEREQRAWWAGVHVAPGATSTLERLRAQGLRIGVCSNAPYRPASLRAQLAHLDLTRRVDTVVFSAEVGWRKPSSYIFTHVLDALGANAATTVVVGDRNREDVGGAHLSGMRAIRLREHHDDSDGEEIAEVVLDRLVDLPDMLR